MRDVKMNLKKVTEKLAEIRDNAKENGRLREEDRQALKSLVSETLTLAQGELKSPMSHYATPQAHNDNRELTADQHFRLRLMEKTGTGSAAIH
jgi:hypothetical protein